MFPSKVFLLMMITMIMMMVMMMPARIYEQQKERDQRVGGDMQLVAAARR